MAHIEATFVAVILRKLKKISFEISCQIFHADMFRLHHTFKAV
jgi:hypothetical protein